MALIPDLLYSLPVSMQKRLAAILGDVVLTVCRSRRRQALTMMKATLGSSWSSQQLQQTAREASRHALACYIDNLLLHRGLLEDPPVQVEVQGYDFLERALERGAGAMLITGRMGNPDLLACLLARKGMEISFITGKQGYRWMHAARVQRLSDFGVRVWTTRYVMGDLRQALHRNGVVMIDMDEVVLPPDGILVDMLGKPAWTTGQLQRWTRKTGSPILSAYLYRKGFLDYHLEIGGEVPFMPHEHPLESQRLHAKACMSTLEEAIRRAPAQWNWFQHRYEGTRDPNALS
jgi:Kdo2-lipid IVA lauroyltransferase/acyltransferase